MLVHRRRRHFHHVMIVTSISLLLGTVGLPSLAASARDLKADAVQFLERLYTTRPEAQQLAKTAHAVLVFPKIVKAGLLFGGSYGEGVMTRGNGFHRYYNSLSASWGWQTEAESYGYVLFLMNHKAVDHLHNINRWEIGIGPSVLVVNEGVDPNFSGSLTQDAYAYIFDQHGMMASQSIEGTKIAQITKK